MGTPRPTTSVADRHRARYFVALVLTITAACAGRGAKEPALGGTGAASAPIQPKSRWILPDGPPRSTAAKTILGDGTRVVVGAGGERWETKGEDVRVAQRLLPEAISAVYPLGTEVRFLGTSGALYEAPSPLAEFRTVTTPAVRITKIAFAGPRFLALDAQRRLRLSVDGGLSWAAVKLPRDLPVVSFEGEGDVALALTAPQYLFGTVDGGVTWEELALPLPVERLGPGLWLVTADGDQRFDAATKKLVAERFGPAPPPLTSLPVDEFALSGKHVLDLRRVGKSWQLGLGTFGSPPKPRPIAGLADCERIDVSLHDADALIACDRNRGTDLFLSDGETLESQGRLPLPGFPNQGELFLGPKGFAFATARCAEDTCGAHFRPRKDAAWVQAPSGARLHTFAPAGNEIYSLGSTDEGTFVFRWIDGAPTKLVRVGESAPGFTSLDVGDDGVLRGVASGKAFVVQGANVRTFALPLGTTSAALSLSGGLAVTDVGLFETVDAATWHPVAAPARLGAVTRCTALGCATNVGVRVDWDGAPTALDRRSRSGWRKPIACKPRGEWSVVGPSDALPTLASVDRGETLWALPVYAKDGAVSLVVSGRDGKQRKLSLLPSADPNPKMGRADAVRILPEGVIAERDAYVRGHRGGKKNPVDVTVAFVRWGSDVVVRATIPQASTFKVPRERGTIPEERAPYLASFDARGVFVGLPYQTGRWPIYHLGDDRSVETLVHFAAPNAPSSALDRLVTVDGVRTIAFDERNRFALQGLGQPNAVVRGTGAEEHDVTALFDFGDTPALALTLDDPEFDPQAFTVPLGRGAPTKLPTQATFDGVPRACTGGFMPSPTTWRYDAPWILGARHPVTIALPSGEVTTTLTSLAELRGTVSSGDACVAAFELPMGFVSLEPKQRSTIFRRDSDGNVAALDLDCAFSSEAPSVAAAELTLPAR